MLARTNLKQGTGLPLVFLHGFLGKATDWEAVCSYLPNCECIGFDLPGHGKSPFMEEFRIPIERFHLIGYSMGGRIAMRYAEKYPEQIVTLTVMSAHPGLLSGEERRKRLEQDRKWSELLFEVPIDDFLKRWYDQSIFNSFRPDFSMRKEQNIEGLAAALIHFSLGRQQSYQITNGLVGERDEKFRALSKNPIIVPNAGHMVHLENPQFVAEQIHRKISW